MNDVPQHAKSHNVAPDIWSWHDLPGDPVTDVGRANSTLAAAGLTNSRPYQIDEYGAPSQQTPGGGAWFILGSDGNTGTVNVNLTGLNTTSVVENSRVRAVVQRVPHNSGAAVAGPETISDTTLVVNGSAASPALPWSSAKDGYTVTLLPPSNTTVSTVAVSQNSGQCSHDHQLVAVHSGKCVDVSNVSTQPRALVHQWTCDPASALGTKKNQIWRLQGKA
ncbi:RICIN domain-containing protein [Streptomyces sp. NPDC051738]|uniref:RICIN domain-containing protein n=1 Tax=Streptomyces sp. NPDC051738 TaxID=3365672 RepID=UPI0037D0B9B9